MIYGCGRKVSARRNLRRHEWPRLSREAQQAAVLLRRWVARLALARRHVPRQQRRLEHLRADSSWWLAARSERHAHWQARIRRNACAVVLALGGASWPQNRLRWDVAGHPCTHSAFRCTPWQAANCGFEIDWDPRVLAAAEGLADQKHHRHRRYPHSVPGELLVTRYGLEGGRALPTRPRALRDDDGPSIAAGRLQARRERGESRRAPSFSGKTLRPKLDRRSARAWRLGTSSARLVGIPDSEVPTNDPTRLARSPTTSKDFPAHLARTTPDCRGDFLRRRGSCGPLSTTDLMLGGTSWTCSSLAR